MNVALDSFLSAPRSPLHDPSAKQIRAPSSISWDSYSGVQTCFRAALWPGRDEEAALDEGELPLTKAWASFLPTGG